jgi:SAM-dependent methyltransferase
MTRPPVTTELASIKPSEHMFKVWSEGVNSDTQDFRWLSGRVACDARLRILDVGGGVGTFADLLAKLGRDFYIDVIDPSKIASDNFMASERVRLIRDDFNSWTPPSGALYDLIVFRHVLHHLIGDTYEASIRTQIMALQKAASLLSSQGQIYLLEIIYEPSIGTDLTSRLIFFATHLQRFSALFRRLGANTAGEGVCFHHLPIWKSILGQCSLRVELEDFDHSWPSLPFWQRIPLMCNKRYQWSCCARSSAQT